MAVSTGEVDYVNTPAGYGGGWGGISPIGLFGVFGGFGNNGWNNGWNNGGPNGAGIVASTVADQNISELRKDVQGVNTTVESLGNELQGAINASNMNNSNNFRNLDNQICGVEKTLLQQSYAQSLQAFQNTQAIQNQMSTFQHATDQQFCAVKQAIASDGDTTRALITQNLIDGLRAELASERRGRDNREIEINVQNNATQTQNQLQAQMQNQNQFIASLLGNLSDQVNRAANSVVQVGTGLVSGSQDNNQANTRVNS